MAVGKSYTIHKGKKSSVRFSEEAVERMCDKLQKTAYRMDSVRILNDVEFVSDTRALDLLSTRDSFQCLRSSAVWLTTTTTHERDFALIEEFVDKKIKAIVVYGAKALDMRDQLGKLVDAFLTVADLSEAVAESFGLAQANDQVIYSPGCVVDDGYANFVDRGRAFAEYVKQLKKN
jgi:UDP-N-acetylmuramoylalanine--D-glutamate ligase